MKERMPMTNGTLRPAFPGPIKLFFALGELLPMGLRVDCGSC